MKFSSALILLASVPASQAFVGSSNNQNSRSITQLSATTKSAEELKIQKQKLFELIGKSSSKDSVLADPLTKEPIEISTSGVLLGGDKGRSNVSFKIQSASNKFAGSSDTFLDLLEPVKDSSKSSSSSSSSESSEPSPLTNFVRQAFPAVPFLLRTPLAALTDGEYVPMRDLFTSPAVSFAYERGWRQAFAQAGFPGPDVESRMAMDYFAPVVARVEPVSNTVVVDMSCATGLFTRRFAASDKYGRVLGCDYSESMLTEARRRINAEPKLSKDALKTTRLDLVKLDVGQIPMQDESIDCLHAGAAMHCWPELDKAAAEIYRVLKPGGRYFATTFLSTYFGTLSNMDGNNAPVSQQAFQYFESVETLRSLLERGGFEKEKIQIEVLGTACVVIRAEK